MIFFQIAPSSLYYNGCIKPRHLTYLLLVEIKYCRGREEGGRGKYVYGVPTSQESGVQTQAREKKRVKKSIFLGNVLKVPCIKYYTNKIE